ncbi:MAG: hypothetical protein LUE06_03685 [Oscillospiraceae bacterium]|nr:hypothetical protein [Oscillospiraceae bacterium]
MHSSELAKAKMRIAVGQNAAAIHAKLIMEQSPLVSSYFCFHMRAYILEKFLLTDTDAPPENLKELARLSIAKSLAMSPELSVIYDTSAGCSNAKSEDTKIALLLRAIEKDLQVTLPLPKAVYAETVSELLHVIWDTLPEAKKAGDYEPV